MPLRSASAPLAVCLGVLLAGCAQQPETPWESYQVTGTVLDLKPAEQVVVLDHEAIGEWMGAMRMGFPVREPAEFSKLAEGMKIQATV